MVWNSKIFFRIFLIILVIIFASILYFGLFDKSGGEGAGFVERALKAVGFDSADDSEDNPAVPLPSGYSGGGGSGAGVAGGSTTVTSSTGSIGAEQQLPFCTFDAYHTITSDVPCRCGFSAVCNEEGQNCDATFNNGEGYCQ